MFAFLLLVAIANANSIDLTKDSNAIWEEYKVKFNRNYSLSEEIKRKAIFLQKLKEIKKHNEGNSTYKMGLTRFSDMDADERKMFFTKGKEQLIALKKMSQKKMHKRDNGLVVVQNLTDYDDVEVGSSYSACVDNDESKCGSINIDQGYCGSCWTVGYAHFLQMAYADLTRAEGNAQFVEPSIQQILDCTSACDGCSGCFAQYGVASNQYVSLATDYPYKDYNVEEGKKHSCQKGKNTPIKVTGMYSFENLSIEDMKKIIKKYGMFISAMYASNNFQDYTQGIFSDAQCPKNNQIETNHVIVVDGYGTENGQEFFWVRNSWGKDWAYEGHFKISTDKLCGIGGDDKGVGSVNFIPIVELAESDTKGTYGKVWLDVGIEDDGGNDDNGDDDNNNDDDDDGFNGTTNMFIALIALLFILF